MEIPIIADRKTGAASNQRRFEMKLVILFAWATFILPFSTAVSFWGLLNKKPPPVSGGL
jgi:hypothetical protein